MHDVLSMTSVDEFWGQRSIGRIFCSKISFIKRFCDVTFIEFQAVSKSDIQSQFLKSSESFLSFKNVAKKNFSILVIFWNWFWVKTTPIWPWSSRLLSLHWGHTICAIMLAFIFVNVKQHLKTLVLQCCTSVVVKCSTHQIAANLLMQYKTFLVHFDHFLSK